MHARLHGDVSLHYVDDDPGAVPARPPVLLLHGFGASSELTWDRTGWVSLLASEGFRTVSPDLRGHGRSGRPRQDDAYLPGVFVADLVVLLDELELDHVDIVGYSMGARLAWELALIRPERVRRVVMGGFGPRDPFSGTDPADPGAGDSPFAALFRLAVELPGNDATALAACARGQAARPFNAEPVPDRTPLLFVVGENDEMADGVEELARGAGAGVMRVANRDHRTAVAASAFKKAVVEFLTTDTSVVRGTAANEQR